MDLNQFISNSMPKTPAMTVDVIDERGFTIYSYKTPPGFQIELYVASCFPMAELTIAANLFDVTVSVIMPESKDIYQIHRGKYNV